LFSFVSLQAVSVYMIMGALKDMMRTLCDLLEIGKHFILFYFVSLQAVSVYMIMGALKGMMSGDDKSQNSASAGGYYEDDGRITVCRVQVITQTISS
jgi:hypothetical protein